MSNWSRAGVAALALLFVAGAAPTYGAPKPDSIKVKVGTLSGVVTDSAGKALKDIALQLKQDGKLILETKSGENGKFALASVPAGKLELIVADGKMPLKLIGSEDADVTRLQIIVPQREPYSAGFLPELGTTTWVWIGVGAGAAAAVATPVIINNTGGTSHGTVSP